MNYLNTILYYLSTKLCELKEIITLLCSKTTLESAWKALTFWALLCIWFKILQTHYYHMHMLKRLYMYTSLRVILIGQYSSCAQQNIWHYTLCVRSDKLKHFLCVNLKLYKLHGLTGIHGDPSTIAFRLTC